MGQDTVNDGDAATDTYPVTSFHSYLHGGTASLVSTTLTTIATFPLYKIVFRQQLHNTLVREAVAQLYGEGLRKLYRGVAPPLLVRTLQGTLSFGIQDTLHRRSSNLVPEHLPRPLLQAAAGVGTGVVEALVFTPFERVQNVLQNGRNDRRLPTQWSVLVRLSSEPLALGFYRALLPIVARNALGSGIYFGLKNPVRDALHQQGLSPTASSFTSGMVNSLIISLPLYPLSVLVANMQAGVGQEDARGGLKKSARKLWAARQRSVALLYRGGSLVILRSCVSWGITTAIYDRLERSSSG
ncbi:solute carrier family 25 member 53-like [Alosa sapidissima]|uniref:solute carrier family 25 member 53-like n=1 Tax=Alosa sapidissima TaxID=34773 RepID=UPI001C082D51|nr:solute carrier family 25 member 53-like [Alosa sapidissima]